MISTLKNKQKSVITFIDFATVFDSVSYRFLDQTLEKVKASRKTHSMFRSIYAVSEDVVRVKGTGGLFTFTKTFNIERGVIQGDIISPILFITVLDQLIQIHDKSGQGITVGHIKCL